MLYRTPRLSVAGLLRPALACLAGAMAEFRQTGTDTTYLDSLSDHHLRDLGIRRFNDRSDNFYR